MTEEEMDNALKLKPVKIKEERWKKVLWIPDASYEAKIMKKQKQGAEK